MSAPSRLEPNELDAVDEPIPAHDLALLSQSGARHIDTLRWAYRLGRVQGQLEAVRYAEKLWKE